ncbi:hypothetical protein [Neorhizobium sp. DAR64860/K0K1]|uniref:hypothetical protein n=1 Tax=Neorhizobium sp. DAR64860/K0K1 TaxID=3421955 RepID=UPI003D26D198
MAQGNNIVSIREEVRSLDDRIADAFDADMSSDALEALQTEVEQASREAKAESQAAADKALDPKVRPAEFADARRKMDDANFRSSRMDAAADQLKEMHRKAVASEARHQAAAEYEAAKAERDQLVKDLEAYDKHARAIASLLDRLSRNDSRLSKANVGQTAATWLHSAQQIARGAQHDFNVQHDERLPNLIGGVRLPNFRIETNSIHGTMWPAATR